MFFLEVLHTLLAKVRNLLSVKKGMLHLILWFMIDIQTIIIAKKKVLSIEL